MNTPCITPIDTATDLSSIPDDELRYRTIRHAINDESSERIRREWSRYFSEFGYS